MSDSGRPTFQGPGNLMPGLPERNAVTKWRTVEDQGFDYTVHGLDELKQFFKLLPFRLSSTIIRQALRDAAKIGVAALKDEAGQHEIHLNMRTLKSRAEHLSDSAVAVTRHYGGNGIEYTAIGFQWPKGAAGWLVEHGHRMVTGGTVARLSGKTPHAKSETLTGAGRVVGFVKPHPIALPAFEKCRPAMEEAFQATVEDGLAEVVPASAS